MIRAVGNKRLDLSDDEYAYFLLLKKEYGQEQFSGLFKTDKNGIITSVMPPHNRQLSMGVLFFLLNVMMNQRLRILDKKIKKVDEYLVVNNIVERLERLEKNSEYEKEQADV